MLKEIAVGNFATAKLAVAKGIDRIELNQHLELGGLTPNRSTWQAVLTLGCPVVVMVRPRAGNFNYNSAEVAVMEATLRTLKEDGVQMVTFGVLNAQLQLDIKTMQHLIQLAAPMRVVMHMAFDAIPVDQQADALHWLAKHQVERILTHGGPLKQPIDKSIQHLKETINQAQDQIEILPGGGINFNNYVQLARELGVEQVHGSQIIDLNP
ncbi:copper homeostasis protein CutC [Weissella coleopterorum]|uniref:PF03932 family protein CutC n=1 Tax=Weissella coleopterorum TaxID=2714949 RepID=A0A6G8AZF4_9LACO|nr:copper homeostasis protein CutC [Weissella coleopterorum]QIL50367.1 copper homeostasis protein CutC [Weissella coleopterorum]